MMMWSGAPGMYSVQELSEAGDSIRILQILIHEAFHALQPYILGGLCGSFGIPGGSTEGAQNKYILEIAALTTAWNSTGEERLAAINDALYMRNSRRQIYDKATYENRLEVMEGLAIYTDMMLTLSPDEIGAKIGSWAESLISLDVLVELQWGYFSGALYGFLLDEFCPDLRISINYAYTDLGQLLQEATGITQITAPRDLELYEYSHIAATTRVRVAEHEKRVQAAIYAMEQPSIRLNVRDDHGFEFSDGISLPDGRWILTAAVVTCRWGRLEVYDGNMIQNWLPQSSFHLSAPDFEVVDNLVYGIGWVLELEENWELYTDNNGFVVRQRR
jgi:hypothetical protein